jgi:hypothetical protein
MRLLRPMWSALSFKPEGLESRRVVVIGLTVVFSSAVLHFSQAAQHYRAMSERQITSKRCGHILTNTGVWSPDSDWIVYDTRPDPEGAVFEGKTIEMVNVRSGEVRTLYESRNGAFCAAATFEPSGKRVVFMLGPEHPSTDWTYCAWHRQGVLVDVNVPGKAQNLDARDLTPPFTPGALRGGTHLHVWAPAGDWVAFTYEDHLLAQFTNAHPGDDINQRNIGISVPGKPLRVSKDHARNHDGDYFSVLVTRTVAESKPGSDQIVRACEEGWIGTNGYVRADESRQRRALAFQGTVVLQNGKTNVEVFVVDLPEDLTVAGEGPLAGTGTRRPFPPKGAVQRRLTSTGAKKFPGIQGPRHWLRSSPDGSQIAFLARDDDGVVQLWTISPNRREPRQASRNQWSVASAFTWSPDGRQITHVMDRSVCVTDMREGQTRRLTERTEAEIAPRPEACVFSPDGSKVAFVRRIDGCNQVCVVEMPKND